MRLTALELLDKLQLCYGLRMLEVLKEADLFMSLLKMYALYPFNDIALRHVTSILTYSLDHKIAKELAEKVIVLKQTRPSRPLDLEEIPTLEESIEEQKTNEDE